MIDHSTTSMSPLRPQPARRPTRVLVVALVMLLVIGAAGVLVAVRRSGGTPGSVQGGGSGAARYRSTAIVRIAAESPAPSPDLTLKRPVTMALSPNLRTLVLKKSKIATDRARVVFVASENAKRTLLTLVVSAPTGAVATSVARNWADAFAAAARADKRNRLLVEAREVDQQLITLNRQLAAIDTDLARLDPATYGNALRYDEPTGPTLDDGGSSTSVTGPPPVPEQGTPHELNLAFERIQLLSARAKAVAKRQMNRFNSFVPPLPHVVSLTPATRIENSK